MRRRLRRSLVLQLGALVLIWGAVTAFVGVLDIPAPAGIVGMLLMLALLAAGWVHPASLRRGADWLFAIMMLFFVPALVAIVDYREFLGLLGLGLLLVIILSTLSVMVVTALTVEWSVRRTARQEGD